MANYQRWEMVDYELPLPSDWHAVSEVLDKLHQELGDRTIFRDAVKVLVDDDTLVFRYRKARGDG
ncbi:hypothetical protein [Sphaerimonospora thailandensis]|uniref:Uncharacterized protein n=1 Tax=Sphaerimonospora thailandensis TaxID=795644 RepID=A0A8J3RAG2_9ACTN|nr:hypothetical protein [Sphaerimonospora thailandensis]GIH70317.1 hypothetical protein Mth01_25700 [Sphaerimonospora thailandensis]